GAFEARGSRMRRFTHPCPGRLFALAALMLTLACAPALAYGDPPPDPVPVDSLVRSFVSLRIEPEHPCHGDSVKLQLVKNGCPPCFHLTSFGTQHLGVITLEGAADWTPLCNELRCAPETLSAPLGRLAAGTFMVTVPMTVRVHRLPEPDTSITFTMRL